MEHLKLDHKTLIQSCLLLEVTTIVKKKYGKEWHVVFIILLFLNIELVKARQENEALTNKTLTIVIE